MSISVKALLVCLLLSIGAVGGFLKTKSYYQPRIKSAIQERDSATSARDNLEALATEQGLKLGELARLGVEREALAKAAQGVAQAEAKPLYAEANRLMSERTGGDQCAAVITVIDQELFGQ